MDVAALIDRLERFPAVLEALVGDVSDADSRWRPEDGAWSIVEITAHLADEEIDDFGRRVRLTLTDPDAPWPPIDPEKAAVERRYQDQDLREVLQRFVAERRRSVVWLRALQSPDWNRSRSHPIAGTLHAGDLLAAWVAHDSLHLRQLAKRRYQMTVRDAAPYGVAYAGKW